MYTFKLVLTSLVCCCLAPSALAFGNSTLCQRAKIFYNNEPSNYTMSTFLTGVTLQVGVTNAPDLLVNTSTNEVYGGYSYGNYY